MMSTNGSSRPSELSSQLLSGSLGAQSTLCVASSSVSASLGKPSRAVVVNFVPSFSSPAMALEPLVMLNFVTWSFSTAVMNSVKLSFSPLSEGHTWLSRRVPTRTARSTGMVQRGQPAPSERPLPPDGGCGPGCWPRPAGGGGGGGGRLLIRQC